MQRTRVAVALGAVCTALLLPASTGALENAEDVQSGIRLPAPVAKGHPKLDSALARLADARRAPGGLVQVEAVARVGRRAELENAIRAAGGTTTGRYAGLIEARLPARALEGIAANPAARRVRSPIKPHPQAVSGEGVAATGAAGWHAAQTAGAGVEIAIVDLGFAGWEQRQQEGELPAQVATADFCPAGLFDGDFAEDHGTAVAEIVHELAPAAKLHLVCIDTLTSLGEAKDYVVANDIPLVNHSVGWLNTSRGDGTGRAGTPEAIVSDARAQGVLWINAAGNYGDAHWSGTFQDTDVGDEFDFHNFSGPDDGNQVLFGDSGCVYLKWDDWPTTDQDFDLYLFRTSDDEPVAASEGVQDGSQEPYEELCVSDLGPADDYYVAIRSDGTTESPRFDLFVTEGQDLEHSVPSGSLVEPANSPAAVAVGAVCVQNGAQQAYSSRGPTIDNRVKPDVSAPDAGSTVTYGPSSGCDSGFMGTSSSTAHATGAAALLKQANPSLGPAELQEALEGKTFDLPPVGKDNDSGRGTLALGSAPPAPPPAPTNAALPTISGFFHQGQSLTAGDGQWTSGGTFFFAFRWLRCNATGGACVAIAGARSKTYVPTAADAGSVLQVRVTASNGGGSAQALSAGTAQIQGPMQPPASVISPSLAGAAQFGQSLSASAGAWSGTAPLSITIEWLRCDSAGATCVVIVGATTATYVLALEDVGATIRVRVTASNPAGSVSLMSPPSGLVASQAPAIVPPAPPSPPPSGTTPPPPPPQTTSQTRLIVIGFVRTPRTPQAGKRFTLVLRVGTRAVSSLGATRRVSCSAKLGRKTLKPTKSLRAGVARCAWAIPRTAAAKRLRSVITVSEGTRSVRRTVTATVRGPRV
jgi:hypothetical protein